MPHWEYGININIQMKPEHFLSGLMDIQLKKNHERVLQYRITVARSFYA